MEGTSAEIENHYPSFSDTFIRHRRRRAGRNRSFRAARLEGTVLEAAARSFHSLAGRSPGYIRARQSIRLQQSRHADAFVRRLGRREGHRTPPRPNTAAPYINET